MEIFNLFHGEADVGPGGDEPPGYELTRAVRVGKKIGAKQMGMSIYELPPGQAICPYHFEWTDEEKRPPGLSWYYVRVQQDEGQLAWASPIWVHTKADGSAR